MCSTVLDASKVDIIVDKYIEYSSDLVRSVKAIVKYSQEFTAHAHEHDFKNVKANGFRSMAKLANKFLDFIINFKSTSTAGDREIDHLERMAETIELMLHFSHMILQKMGPQHGSPENFCTDGKLNIETICSIEKYKHLLPSLFGKYGNFQYSASFQAALRVYIGVAALIWTGPFSVKSIFSLITDPYNCAAEAFVDFGLNSDGKTFSKVLNVFTNSYYTGAVSLLMNGINKLSIDETVYLSVQCKYKIFSDGHLEEVSPPFVRSKAIRCRYFLSEKDDTNDTLVLHVHGSAFLAMSTESFQMLTRGWSQKLGCVPILSVNYSLSPESKFPVALQELLDIYLHIISGEEKVKDVLGFTPTRVVFTGDSAGANMLMALLCVINDLNKKLHASIRLPKAAMLIYPALTVSFSLTPSRLFTLNDVVLPTYLVMEVIQAYVHLNDEFEEDKLSEEERKLKWFLRKYPSSGFEKIQRKLETPYISPLFYEDFQSLESVDLYLVTSEYDVFLDDSVSLAHKWKGKVSLDVVPDLPHAFLHFMGTASEITAAYDVCTDRLCQSVAK